MKTNRKTHKKKSLTFHEHTKSQQATALCERLQTHQYLKLEKSELALTHAAELFKIPLVSNGDCELDPKNVGHLANVISAGCK